MESIIKPIIDKRDFKGGILDNNIKYIIINDKDLDKSYVSVCVNVGSYFNPKEYQGLAHFLEHMLFMGSKKYPQVNYFMNQVNEYGGYTNAYTASLNTTYFFNVFDNGLDHIIDILTQFFIEPLFDSNSIQKEINAVNNEHIKNINNDYYKLYYLGLYLADKDSIINTFSTGSLKTLNKKDIREKMIEFYNKYYTTDNLSICIASSKSVDNIFNLINNTFGCIKPKNESITQFKLKFPSNLIKPYYTKNINNKYYFKTSMDINVITYIWDIPIDTVDDFKILDLLLNNKSKTSLYYYLKVNGFLKYINSSIDEEGIFVITLYLTDDGYNNLPYINHLLFIYLEKIYDIDINQFALYHQKILNINFNYSSKDDTENLCNTLNYYHLKYDTKNVYKYISVIYDLKSSDYYKTLFSKYINQNNNVIIISSNKIINDITYYSLHNYNDKYGKLNIDLKYNKKISINNIGNIDLNNSYLDLKIINYNNFSNNKPFLINKNVWFGSYNNFNEPIINIWLQLNNLNFHANPTNYILTHISCDILNFLINILLYKPLELGYNIDFSSDYIHSSININISGFNDKIKLEKLLLDLFNILHNIDKYYNIITKKYVNNLLLNFIKRLNNKKYLNSWEYNDVIINSDIYPNYFNDNKLYKYFKYIIYKKTYKDIKLYTKNIFLNEKTCMTSFIYGNIDKFNITNILSDQTYNNKYYSYLKLNLLSTKIIKHPNIKETATYLGYYYYIGKFKIKKYLLMLLCVNIFRERFFDILRTKYQLGYLVKMTLELHRDHYYIAQKIQSNNKIDDIKSKLNDFNNNLLEYLNTIDFNKYLITLRNNIKNKDNNLDEIYSRYCNEIISRKYLFNRKEILLNNIKLLSKEKLIKFIKKYINTNNQILRIIEGN
jgi:insulysin